LIEEQQRIYKSSAEKENIVKIKEGKGGTSGKILVFLSFSVQNHHSGEMLLRTKQGKEDHAQSKQNKTFQKCSRKNGD
jgi:hypothetical protein